MKRKNVKGLIEQTGNEIVSRMGFESWCVVEFFRAKEVNDFHTMRLLHKYAMDGDFNEIEEG